MQITYVGHAGFIVETRGAVVVAGPWVSADGAFDSAWMQLPQNHHMAAAVRAKLEAPGKERFIFISHEHKDHFDPEFLASLRERDFTLLVPRFRRAALREMLSAYTCKRLIAFQDGDKIAIPGGYLRFYVDDSGLNRDSALLVKADGKTFLNFNDCKVHDRVPQIVQEEGPIDVFTAQFSGAIWHPTCYEYDRRAYAVLSRKKMISKFEAVARAMDVLRPKYYLSSAGPACFLDPRLFHLNFEEVNIFPRAPRFFAYLQKRIRNLTTKLIEPMPGDVLDADSGAFKVVATERINDDNVEQYIRSYAKRMEGLFQGRARNRLPEESEGTRQQLRTELKRKLDALELRERVVMPLYVALEELPDRYLKVDFARGAVEDATQLPADNRYTLTVRGADIQRVLDRKMTWDEYMLSFRMKLSRVPDTYDALLHGYLAMEAEDIPVLCEKVRAAEARQDRIVVEAGGQRYSIRRFCPHQGADLKQAWIEGERYLVCPRHRWQFDLKNDGACTANCTSIQAQPVTKQDEPKQDEVTAASPMTNA